MENKWFDVTMVYNHEAKTVTIWVDGKQKESKVTHFIISANVIETNNLAFYLNDLAHNHSSIVLVTLKWGWFSSHFHHQINSKNNYDVQSIVYLAKLKIKDLLDNF